MRVVTREHRFWLFLLYFQGRVTTRSGQPIKARRCPAESGAGCIMDSALVLCAAAGTPERQLAMERRSTAQQAWDHAGVGSPMRDPRGGQARSADAFLEEGQSMVLRHEGRCSALWSLIERSISNRASMRQTASRAGGEIGAGVLPCALRWAFSAPSAMMKKGRRAWTQQAASRIGPGLRSSSYSLLYPP